jgi:hypothetical protein
MKHPESLDINVNVIQQIQISHNFVEGKTPLENYMITELKELKAVSFSNPDREIIIVLVLDKYDDANDFINVLEEFNRPLQEELAEEELKKQLEKTFNSLSSVFRTRDEVITKLSNQVASLKMKEYDLERRFEQVVTSDLSVKSKILYLLTIRDYSSFQDFRSFIKTSKRWLESVVKMLVKNNVIAYDSKKDSYFLKF